MAQCRLVLFSARACELTHSMQYAVLLLDPRALLQRACNSNRQRSGFCAALVQLR